MDKILHHFESIGNHGLLVFTGESSLQGFLGAGFCPSTVRSYWRWLEHGQHGLRPELILVMFCPKESSPHVPEGSMTILNRNPQDQLPVQVTRIVCHFLWISIWLRVNPCFEVDPLGKSIQITVASPEWVLAAFTTPRKKQKRREEKPIAPSSCAPRLRSSTRKTWCCSCSPSQGPNTRRAARFWRLGNE